LAQRAGHKVKILHLDIEPTDILAECKLFKPDIVALTVNTLQVKSARSISREVKREFPDIKIVVGGPHAAFWDGVADEVVVGEGENRWLEILGESSRINSLDDIPELYYNLVDFSKFCGHPPLRLRPAATIMTSRGCPFNCIFCNTPIFWGKGVRYRSAGLVVEGIERLSKYFGVREVSFQDDTMNLNPEWASEIFEGIIRAGLNDKVHFRMTSRANEKMVTKEFLDLAKQAGVWQIFYGVESGSPYMLNRMKKGITISEIKRAVRMTREAGIGVYCSFIVGLPGESWQTLAETQELIEEIQPVSFNWGYACPFPGTEFDNEVIAKGHKLSNDYGEYAYGKLMARTDALSFEELASFRGFKAKGGLKMNSWGDFYRDICGNKLRLEGNIMEHSFLLWTISRYVSPGDKVLEIGAGTGVMAYPLSQAGIKVISIDNDTEILRMAPINAAVFDADIEYQEADAFHLPFPDRAFKVAFSEGLLEHYSDEDISRLVAEHQRVADVVVVSVPLKGSRNVAYGNERWLTMAEWENIFMPMGCREGAQYGHEVNACFTFIRRE